MPKKDNHDPTPGRSEIQAAAARDRRASNAAGTHEDRRTKRLRDRAAQRRAALTEETDHE